MNFFHKFFKLFKKKVLWILILHKPNTYDFSQKLYLVNIQY